MIVTDMEILDKGGSIWEHILCCLDSHSKE